MTRDTYKKAKRIIETIDKIDNVLNATIIIHNNGETVKYNFNPDCKTHEDMSNVEYLATHVVSTEFLQALYNKKKQLEQELKDL